MQTEKGLSKAGLYHRVVGISRREGTCRDNTVTASLWVGHCMRTLRKSAEKQNGWQEMY